MKAVKFFDSERASEAISAAYAPAKIVSSNRGVMDLEVYDRATENLGLVGIATSSGVLMTSVVPFDGYSVILPTSGSVEFAIRGSSFPVPCSGGLVADCQTVDHAEMCQDSSYLGLSVTKTNLAHAFRKFAQTDLREPLAFDHGISTDLASALRQLFFLVSSGIDSRILIDNPLAMTSLDEAILRLLLYSQPHNYSRRLRGVSALALPRDVRRAMRYIDQFCHTPITVSDVARESGVGLRTLQASFSRYADMSPYSYLRSRRLEGARQDILGGKATSVTAAAKLWGFVSLGQFSKLYVEVYGELPSQTLRQLP